jgi:hypothetical protein
MSYTLFTAFAQRGSDLEGCLSRGSFTLMFKDATYGPKTLEVCAEKQGSMSTVFAIITKNPHEVRRNLVMMADVAQDQGVFFDFDEFEAVHTYAEAEDEAAAEFCNFG